jgi:hypothetical protein
MPEQKVKTPVKTLHSFFKAARIKVEPPVLVLKTVAVEVVKIEKPNGIKKAKAEKKEKKPKKEAKVVE